MYIYNIYKYICIVYIYIYTIYIYITCMYLYVYLNIIYMYIYMYIYTYIYIMRNSSQWKTTSASSNNTRSFMSLLDNHQLKIVTNVQIAI